MYIIVNQLKIIPKIITIPITKLTWIVYTESLNLKSKTHIYLETYLRIINSTLITRISKV